MNFEMKEEPDGESGNSYIRNNTYLSVKSECSNNAVRNMVSDTPNYVSHLLHQVSSGTDVSTPTHRHNSNEIKHTESLSCPKCNDIFEAESKYTDHVLTHSPWHIMYVCDVCGLTLEQKNSLADHITAHIISEENHDGYYDSNDNNINDSDDSDVALIDLLNKSQINRKRKKHESSACLAEFDNNHQPADHISSHNKMQRVTRKSRNSIIKRTKTQEEVLKCNECDECFTCLRDVRAHARIHKRGTIDILTCEMCEASFPTKKLITKHLSKHLKKLGGEIISCSMCDKTFNRQNTLRYHERKHHDRNPPLKSHTCEVCGLPCVSRSRLENHMRVHTGERPYQCNVCEKAFSHSGSLAQHMKTHEERKHVCPICNNAFTRRTHLMNHLSTHSGQKPFVCSTCGKTFAYSVTLKMHMRTHSGERPHVCNSCGKAFVRKDQLNQHTKVHTRERPFVCDKCGKGFAHRAALKVHNWRDHFGEYPPEQLGPPPPQAQAIDREHAAKTHVCSTCGKTFLTRAELTQHSVVHSGVKPYRCQSCEKAFARKSGLVLHNRVHTGEKPYLCINCGKNFSTQSGLRTHVLLVHSGEKPHVCPTCGKGFPTKDRLTVHVRFHTGEKPFVCGSCGKGFTRSDNLKAHIKTHSGERPYACLMCDRAFYNKCELVKHLQAYPMHKPSDMSTAIPDTI